MVSVCVCVCWCDISFSYNNFAFHKIKKITENVVPNAQPVYLSPRKPTGMHDCVQIEKENEKLKRKLADTHTAYKNILEQLRVANSLKEKRVERAIRQEICKMHTVLKSVRSNIESVEQNRKADQS